MINPQVSIIIPSYNQGNFIRRTMESIINQSYKNIEVIIIDGLSTDNTIEVLSNYSDQITCLVSEKDKGQSDAINKGLMIAKGDIVGWMNSDDLFVEDSVSTIVEAFSKDDSLGFVYGNVDIIDETDAVVGRYYGKAVSFPNIFWSLDLPIPMQGTFWNKKNLKFNLQITTEYHFVLDRDIFLRTILNTKCKYLNKTLGCFRYHDSSKSISQKSGWIKEMPLMYKSILTDYPDRFNNADIRKIKAMPYSYIFFEYIKAGDFFHAFLSILKAFKYSPSVIFRLNLKSKLKKIF